jgi:hypothetical protein
MYSNFLLNVYLRGIYYNIFKMDISSMRWKAEKEIRTLNQQLEEIIRAKRSRRKVVGDLMKIADRSRDEKVFETAFAADSELRNLEDEELCLNKKIESWNTLLKVNVNQLPISLMKQINEEYAEYKNKLISDAINVLFMYDSTTSKFVTK